MKTLLIQLLQTALKTCQKTHNLPEIECTINIDRTKDSKHGDFATNLALILAKPWQKAPRQIAELLIAALPKDAAISKVEIAGPGFINFFINPESRLEIIKNILHLKNKFGLNNTGNNEKVLLEFVSANPTGPLHVGHGRAAAFGATLANVLKACGYDVCTEYYVNDAGRQMDILAVSVWMRYLELAGENIVFPANGYQGDYVYKIAEDIIEKHGRDYVHDWKVITRDLPSDEHDGGDKEQYIDALIKSAKILLTTEGFAHFHQYALDDVLAGIKIDLEEFGVTYDDWFSEKSLFTKGAITKGIEALKATGDTYEQDGALWFRATKFGDEKDRVLIRANGTPTYFASDIAYHWDKYDRGYSKVIDIVGADHHGYFARVKAAMRALGHDDTAINFLFVQFVILYRGKMRVQMSTRSGSFVTLRDLRTEVGNDVARFFYLLRKLEQHMDFDLDLAKSHSNDNPVYYVQYAHARICSVMRQLQERHLDWNQDLGFNNLIKLNLEHEENLVTIISQYPEIVAIAGKTCEPHQIVYYLRELAANLHSYYNAVPLLCKEDDVRNARLCLIAAVRQVLHNGMQLLGVTPLESM